MYQFRFPDAADTGRTEELGFFNDDGALRYAARIGDGKPVEVWRGSERIGAGAAPALTPEIAAS